MFTGAVRLAGPWAASLPTPLWARQLQHREVALEGAQAGLYWEVA